MSILTDEQISELAEKGMIQPFTPALVRKSGSSQKPVISFGLSSMGYDIRLASEFKVFTNVHGAVVDPKNMDTRAFVDIHSESDILIPPNSFALGRSVERFRLPHDIIGVVLAKSTYARCGISVNCTPMEPGWAGWLTIEISNSTPLPARVYVHEGIAQVLFFKSNRRVMTSYADRNGKYQDQGPEIVLPRV